MFARTPVVHWAMLAWAWLGKRARLEHAIPALGFVVLLLNPLLCVWHCHMLDIVHASSSAGSQRTPLFTCHFGQLAHASGGQESTNQMSAAHAGIAVKAFYECVSAALIAVIIVLLVRIHPRDQLARYITFARVPQPPPPKALSFTA